MPVLLYRGRSPASLAIRWFTRGPYSHASFYDDASGFEYEAWLNGVTKTPGIGMHHLPQTVVDVFDITLSPDANRRLITCLESFLGRRYDPIGLVKFVTRTRQPDYSRALFCSEYIAAAFQLSGTPLLLRASPFVIHPTMLSYSPLLSDPKTIVTRGRAPEFPAPTCAGGN